MFGYEFFEMMWGRPRRTDNPIRTEFKFTDIEDFYKSALSFDTTTGNRDQYLEILHNRNPEWVGMTLSDIEKYKYSYAPGVPHLEQIKEDLLIPATSSFKTKWDDVDGEDMSMERLYDELPFMSKRVRKHGFLNGKFVKLYIDISENSHVEYTDMLHKTYTAVSIVDYLESMGYRTEVYATAKTISLGRRKGEDVEQAYVEIPVKKLDESLNTSLLLTLLSPWAFRFWILLLYSANVYTSYGMGRASYEKPETTLGTLYINTGDCLTKESSEHFINQIKTMYDQDFQEDVYK